MKNSNSPTFAAIRGDELLNFYDTWKFIGHFKSDMDSFRKKSNLSTTFEEDWGEMGSSFKISKDDKKNPSNYMTSKSLEVTIRVFASDILGKKGAHHLSSGKVTWTMKSWLVNKGSVIDGFWNYPPKNDWVVSSPKTTCWLTSFFPAKRQGIPPDGRIGTLQGTNRSRLWKRTIILNSMLPFQGICDRSQEAISCHSPVGGFFNPPTKMKHI